MVHDWWWSDSMTMGWQHWVVFIVAVALVLYPLGRILKRLGLSPFWSVLAFIPLINLAALWALALAEWPRRKEQS
jgi:NADH:ubiquinone oxidoreductase subunit 3 (subunit A)